MKRYFSFLLICCLVVVSCGNNSSKKQNDSEATDSTDVLSTEVPEAVFNINNLPEEPIFDIITSKGVIAVKLYSKTPRHKKNFIKLAQEKFYQGTQFHRCINGFMIQGGDPFTADTAKKAQWGQGGPGYTIPAEFVNEYYHKRGALAAARIGDLANPTKASSGSQFYIVQDEMACLHLDGEYTIFGEVVNGMDVVDKIARVGTDDLDRPLSPIYIYQVAPDFPMMEKERKAKQEAADSAAVEK